MSELIQKTIENTDFVALNLNKSIKTALHIWEEGRKKPKLEEEPDLSTEANDEVDDEMEGYPTDLKDAFERWNLEVAVLNNNTERKCLYRLLSASEISALQSEVI